MSILDNEMAAILGELSGTPVSADAALVAAATETAKTATAPADYLSHLMVAHATAIAEERARSEAAKQEALRSRGLFGWVIAGALSFVVIFLLVSKRT